MDNTKIIGIFISLAISVMIIGSVLVPIISDSQTEIRSRANNDTAYYIADTEINEDLTFSFNADTDEFFVNGEVINWNLAPVGPSYKQIFVFTNAFGLSFGASHAALTFVTLDDLTITSAKAVSIFADNSWTVTKMDNTVVNGSTPIEWAYYPSNDGNLGCYSLDFNISAGETAHILSSTGMITSISDGTKSSVWAKYTVVDGVATKEYAKAISSTGVVDIDPVINVPAGQMENGYYHYESGQWTVSVDGYTNSINGVMFAPIEYEYISSTDSAAIQLLTAVPILVILSLIVVAVGVFAKNRY